MLRRKLITGSALDSKRSKVSKAKIDGVGKPNAAGEYEIKPIDEQERRDALVQFQEFADEEFLQDFKKWYTEEDWKWLTDNLQKAGETNTGIEGK